MIDKSKGCHWDRILKQHHPLPEFTCMICGMIYCWACGSQKNGGTCCPKCYTPFNQIEFEKQTELRLSL